MEYETEAELIKCDTINEVETYINEKIEKSYACIDDFTVISGTEKILKSVEHVTKIKVVGFKNE